MERTKTPINPWGLPNITIPAELIFHPDLTWSDRALFGFINTLAANDKKYCWASNQYLAKSMGLRPNTISIMLSKLQKAHFIIMEYEKRYDGMNVRKIRIDKTYPQRYDKDLGEAQERIKNTDKNPFDLNQRGVLVKSKGGISKIKGGYYKNQSNIDIKLDKELDIKSLPRNEQKGLFFKEEEVKKSNISPDQFEEFWKLYPRKEGKGGENGAKAKWIALSKKPLKEQPLFQDIMKALQEHIKCDQWQNPKYIPYPTTWLNQERWNDEVIPASSKKPNRNGIITNPNTGINAKVRVQSQTTFKGGQNS